MSNLDSAIQRAGHVNGRKGAARLYNDIEYELALGEHSEEEWTAGEQALTILENRFPQIRNDAREVEQPPQLSRRAADTLPRIGQSRVLQRRQHPWLVIGGLVACAIMLLTVHFWATIIMLVSLAILSRRFGRR